MYEAVFLIRGECNKTGNSFFPCLLWTAAAALPALSPAPGEARSPLLGERTGRAGNGERGGILKRGIEAVMSKTVRYETSGLVFWFLFFYT